MFKINNQNKIMITRGDNATLELFILDDNDNDNEYAIEETDKLTFSLKKYVAEEKYLLQK